MNNAISVKDLKKNYKEHEAVKGISFDVKEGEFFAFLGENGAGKSTTINMLCTILSKTSGDVRIFGHELGKEDDSIRNLIGIVFQNSVLDNKLTVKENLLTRGAYYGLNKKQVLERIKPFMESFELAEIWNRRYERLSGGQRRRVDIMRALIHDPKILFLDEPTTGLDPKSRMLVWEHIRRLKEEKNLTIFLTTHYMEEVETLCDRIIILDKGNILARGTSDELKELAEIEERITVEVNDLDSKYIDKILEFKNVDVVTYSDNILLITYKKGKNNISDMVEFLKNNRIKYNKIFSERPTLNDVFLELTGKELRD